MNRLRIFLFAAAFAFAFAAGLRAQDAAAPFRRSTPPPEGSPAASETPTPAPRAAETPAPEPPRAQPAGPAAAPNQPEQTPAPTREESTETSAGPRARGILNEKPVRAVEPHKPFPRRSPAAEERDRGGDETRRDAKKRRAPLIRRIVGRRDDGPRASRPTFDLAESNWATAATLRSLEQRWQAALKNKDVEALGQLLAPDFVGTSADGRTASKSRMLSLLRNDKNVYRSARAHGMKVSMTGPRTAVVTGRTTESGTTEDGRRFKVTRYFTDTWRERNGRWRCVSSKVSEQPEG